MAQATEIIIRAKDETQQAIGQVTQSLGALESKAIALGPLFGAMAAALSFATFKGAIDGAISFAAKLDDMSEATGATVENLSALASVAKIGSHDLGLVESSLQKLSKALHSTDEETKGAGKALAAIGLDISKLADMDTADAMYEIAKSMSQFQNDSGKAAVAMAIFGKSGAQPLPFLNDLAEKTELVGKVTAEQAAMAEQYEKNMNRLSASFSVTGKTVAMELLPFLTKLTDEMVSAKESTGGFSEAIGNGARTALETAAVLGVNTIYVFKQVGNEIGGIAAQLAAFASLDFKGARAIGNMMKEDAAQARKEVDALTARIIDRSKATQDAVAAMAKPKINFTDDTDKPDKKKNSAADEAQRLIDSLNQEIAVKLADAASTDKISNAEAQAVKVKEQLAAGTLKVTAAQKATILSKLDDLQAAEKAAAAQENYRKALADQTKANETARQSMEKAIETAQKQYETYGLSEVQISRLIEARLQDAIAIASQNGAGEDAIAYLKQELELRQKLSDTLDDLDTKRLLSGTDTSKYAKQHQDVEALNKKLQDGKINETEYDEAINAMMGKSQEALTSMEAFAQSAAHNMQSALADFFINPTNNGFKGLADSFGQTVQKMIAEAASAKIMQTLFGTMGGTTGGKSTGSGGSDWGWVGQAMTWAAAFFADGGIMTGQGPVPLRKYAAGGIANRPQLAMFGEGSTPEAYVPLPDGRRIPVAMQGGQGSMTINQTIYAGQGTDAAQVRRSAAAGARAALGAMNGAKRYG